MASIELYVAIIHSMQCMKYILVVIKTDIIIARIGNKRGC